MTTKLERAWSNSIQKEFLQGLDAGQTKALLDLLLVSTFADQSVSLEERRGVSLAMSKLPEIDEALEMNSEEVVERTEELYRRFDEDRGALLSELSTRLGEDAVRHAFRTTVQLLSADGFEKSEEEFVRDLGEQMGIEETIVDFAIRDAQQA